MKNLFLSPSPDATEQYAATWVKQLKPGAVIALVGALGSGKTTFVRGLYRGLGGRDEAIVHSPTFTLFNRYPVSHCTLNHVDLYRLDTLDDYRLCAIEDYYAGNITVIEWADRINELKGIFKYRVEFGHRGESAREIHLNKKSC